MNAQFTKAFNQLLGLRSHYEDLRTSGGSFEERAEALQTLHRQRAEIAYLRISSI